MKKLLFVALAVISLTSCTKSSDDLPAVESKKELLYIQVEAVNSDGSSDYSVITAVR